MSKQTKHGSWSHSQCWQLIGEHEYSLNNWLRDLFVEYDTECLLWAEWEEEVRWSEARATENRSKKKKKCEFLVAWKIHLPIHQSASPSQGLTNGRVGVIYLRLPRPPGNHNEECGKWKSSWTVQIAINKLFRLLGSDFVVQLRMKCNLCSQIFKFLPTGNQWIS